MDPQTHTTIGTSDDVLSPDEARKQGDAISDEFGMLDDVARMTDNAGNQNLAARQLHFFPKFPFMLVPRVGCLDGIRAGFHFQHEVDDMLQRQIVRMRSVPTSPANVIAHAILRNAL